MKLFFVFRCIGGAAGAGRVTAKRARENSNAGPNFEAVEARKPPTLSESTKAQPTWSFRRKKTSHSWRRATKCSKSITSNAVTDPTVKVAALAHYGRLPKLSLIKILPRSQPQSQLPPRRKSLIVPWALIIMPLLKVLMRLNGVGLHLKSTT